MTFQPDKADMLMVVAVSRFYSNIVLVVRLQMDDIYQILGTIMKIIDTAPGNIKVERQDMFRIKIQTKKNRNC